MKRRRQVRILLVIFLLTVCGACGKSKTVKVNGLVTLYGEPVSNATIVFTPVTQGRQGNGITDGAGKFVLSSFSTNDGVPPGDYKITVVKDPNFAADFKPLTVEDVIEQAKTPLTKVPSVLHENYATISKTPLKVTVPPSVVHLELNSLGK